MDKQRFFPKFFVVLFICVLMFPCCESDVNGEEWKLYFESVNGMIYYYDAESIRYLPRNIVQVWIKNFPANEDMRLNYIQSLRKKEPIVQDNIKYSTALAEIDCKNITYACLQLKVYNIENAVVMSEIIKEPSAEAIPPESMVNTLHKVVCAKKNLKKNRR